MTDEKRVIVFGESDGIFTREFLPEPAFEASSGNIYISGVEGLPARPMPAGA